MSGTKQMKCYCGKEYTAKKADLARGWAKSCSKSCAAKKRERDLDRNNYSGIARSNRPRGHLGPWFDNAHQFDSTEL